MVTEVEVKTETENQKGKESQKEHARTILDYDEGFKPEYRNKVKTVNVPEHVPEIPEEEDVVAQDDEETVLKAGEPEEHEEPKEPSEVQEPEDFRYRSFKVGMQTDTWNQVIKLLSTLVTEARFVWKNEGLKVVSVDPAHTAMYEILVPNEALMERVAEEDTEFALDLKTFPKLKNGGMFYMSRKSKNQIKIDNDGVAQTVMEMDLDSITIPRVPEINSKCRATVKIEPFRKFFGIAKNISDAIRMTMHVEGILILSARSDSNEAETVLNRENNDILDISMSGEQTVRSSYPLDYIQNMVKAASTVTEMAINYKTDYPLAVSFKLPMVAKKDKGKYPPGIIPVRFLLAPRMEQ